MQTLNHEIFLGLEDPAHLARVAVRLFFAMILGGFLGFEREEEGKAAGLRTHMLVSLASALFILVCIESGASIEHLTRVAQGLTAAIGFLGGGAILKLTDQHKIKGLTTAANLWVAAATGMAVGMGYLWAATIAVLFAWFILIVVHQLEPSLHRLHKKLGLGKKPMDEAKPPNR